MAKYLVLLCNVCFGFLFCISISPLLRVRAREGITPPPRTGDNKPIVANGRVYYLDYIPRRCWTPIITKYPYGGRVDQPRALMKKDNPHKIKGSIQIAPSGCLYIEPGCRLEFAPGQGLIVNGTLIARGSEEVGGRIVFTKDRDYDDVVGKQRPWRTDARLVDGNTTMDGRLELFYQQKWRGVCTNYNNFTKEDANVTCRHLGFLKGNFTYHSFSQNVSDYLLLEKPNCTGSEDSLPECSGWTTIKAGLHICDGQQTIGFECEGFQPGVAVTHWRGIEFYNSSTQFVTNETINTKMEESDSSIWYSDVEYAGLDVFREGVLGINHPYASISASPFVPFMDNVTISNGAYDALNFTYILGKVNVQNCTIQDNRGHGMYVKSVVGEVKIEKSVIQRNWGDGIKFYSINKTLPHDFDRLFSQPYFFCKRVQLSYNRYPIYLGEQVVHTNSYDIAVPGCEHTFTTRENMQLTLHFLLLETDPESEGELIISYGDVGKTMTKTVPIRNGSYPQSITTLSNVIKINFNFKRRGYCSVFKYCIRFLLRLSTNFGPTPDFWITESNVSNNNHHGISVQDMRCLIWVNSTRIMNNGYEAGLRVFQGAGIVNVNNTLLQNNALAGANITYSGGRILFNHTRAIGNQGYGVYLEFLKLNRSRIEQGLDIYSYSSKFSENSLAAFRVGNYCKSADVLIDKSFFENNLREAIEYLSCNTTSPTTNFSVTMSQFVSNGKQAILMAPILNTRGKIANNTFRDHLNGALLMNNGEDILVSRWYAKFPVDYDMYGNEFRDNHGPYAVNIRLTEESSEQSLMFINNKLLDNNIQNSFPFLNPRSKANAVLIISSSKVVAVLNIISNPNSTREMATHLTDPSKTIDATMNYWGSPDYQNFYLRIFDRDDRYNLAIINFFPALADERIFGDRQVTPALKPDSKNIFLRGQIIGGELKENKVLPKGFYTVDKDIYIEPEATLTIPPGTELSFQNSVGMIVYGALVADGRKEDWVRFSLEDNYDTVVENMTFPIRLVDGTTEQEGRLEVELGGTWGTVCNKGWTEQNSVVACNQLGLAYNPRFGQPQVKASAPTSSSILLNWVSCTEEDTDLTKCLSDSQTPIDCSHDQDVFIHCQIPTWSGITLAAVPKIKDRQETQLRSVMIDRAGMHDHSTMHFSSALQIDYNYYDISNVTVTESSADGIYVRLNHPYTNNRMEHCNVHRSQGHGLVTKYPFLETAYSTFRDNFLSGFTYDPFFTEAEAIGIRNFMRSDQVTVLKESQSFPLTQETTLFITEPGKFRIDKEFTYVIKSTDYKLRPTIQILNYNPVTSVEKVTVINNNKKYYIEEDLIDFPLMSSGNLLTVVLRVSGTMSGRLTFAIILGQRTEVPKPEIYLRNCTLVNNDIGLVTKHYNNPSNDKQELYFRFGEESIRLDYVDILNSRTRAMYVPSVTKYHENFIPTYEELTRPQRVGTISYVMTWCRFQGNRQAIKAEHNHVEFANNVWKWHITHSSIKDNMDGGLEIELPRVNDVEEHLKHSVEISHTMFEMNKNFAFIVNGYFADVNISHSIWKNNICRLGLFDLIGMEKNVSMVLNVFDKNTCKYIVNFDINSHYEYMYPIVGNFSYNKLYDNGLGTETGGDENLPSSFAVALKGLQQMVLNRNLFQNPKLRYEFIAGVTCLSLDSVVDVTENWWGNSAQDYIQSKIFDFDSWNNFAIAEYIPFLIENQFDSVPFSTTKQYPIRNTFELGGRITKDVSLFASATHYEVINDITVMPGVTLKIEPGVVLIFRPNIGILVLGTLDARGLPHQRIKLFPSSVKTKENNIRKRSVSFQMQQISKEKARLSGGATANEGFLQFYNDSTKQWDIMCNERLPENVGKVICRQLGFETINVRVYTSHLFDYYIYGLTTYFTKTFWRYSYYCKGNEDSLDQCIKKIDYRIMSCIQNENYTFLHCGKRNVAEGYNYWGNIRFSRSSYQENLQEKKPVESTIKYVDIYGAGVLHGNKVGAIQSVYQTPIIEQVNISGCASNGMDFISPLKDLLIEEQNITANLGYGINILVLNGDSKNEMASFLPLVQSTIPYFLFGVVEMCLLEKEIILETKMLIYYKYSSNAIDCVKSIKSKYRDKQLALRFLQMNLFSEDFMRNVIEIFDGDFGNEQKIGEIMKNSTSETVEELYRTSKEPHTLTLHIHASVASRDYGFIAEVVTLPQSSTGIIDSRIQHTLQSTSLQRNEDGAFTYRNVGEINPSVKLTKCLVEDNGVRILNLTSPPVVDIYLQNTKMMSFANNFLLGNAGGSSMILHTKSFATAIEANITNNIFSSGTHGCTLTVSGHNYQKVLLYENYFFNNSVGDDQDIVQLKGVTTNFTSNFFHNNTAYSILSVFALEKVSSPHMYTRSAFTKNNSTALYESTVKVHSGKPVFYNNYFVNPENVYEFEANPVSKFSGSMEPINAKENWWGVREEFFIAAKILDAANNESLVPVDYKPYKVLPPVDGNCAPGWIAEKTRCFRYMGGVQTYYGAVKYCQSLGAELMESKEMESFAKKLLIDSDFDYNTNLRIWINKPSSLGMCGIFYDDYAETHESCHLLLLPFICESDPFVVKTTDYTLIIALTASIFSVLVIIIIILIVLWLKKSKIRKDMRLQRCASLRSSARSRSQMTSNWSKSNIQNSQTNISFVGTLDDHISINSIDKSKFNTFDTEATEISPPFAIKTPRTTVIPYGHDNGNDTDSNDNVSFTDDESYISIDDGDKDRPSAVRYNTNVMNQVWKEREQEERRVTQQSLPPNEWNIYANLGLNKQNKLPSEHCLYSDEFDKKPIINQMQTAVEKPPSPPPPLYNYEPSEEFKSFSKIINQRSRDGSKESLDGRARPSPYIRGEPPRRPEVVPRDINIVPNQGRTSNFGSRENLADYRYGDPSRNVQERVPEAFQTLNPGVAYLQRNTYERGSRDRINSPEPFNHEPTSRDYNDYGGVLYNPNVADPYRRQPMQGSRENLDSIARPHQRQYKPTPAPRPVTRSRENVTQPSQPVPYREPQQDNKQQALETEIF
ncbi:protein bark beetle-like isoform X1 [Octopus sinensis]|uniref:Protein bark beetle-like isoform X1 n=1 Tax=Octopus sinensis TaxID=2607531 RepID=A0A6P7TUU8_9MOLL|nr:protein bark beetle-like isoform X1 [Octopus sinensis]